jgi:hypothetical protein
MYDLEHDDETVVISSLLKWLPAEVLYHMRHTNEFVVSQKAKIRAGDCGRGFSHRLYQPVAQKNVYKFSFFPRTIRERNLLPASVTDADKLEEFRGRIYVSSSSSR